MLQRLSFLQRRAGATLPAARAGDIDVAVFAANFPPEPTGIAPYAGALAAGLVTAGFRASVYVAHPHYPEWRIHDGYGGWRQREVYQGARVQRLLHYVPRNPRGFRRLASELSLGLRFALTRWDSPRVVVALSPPLFSTAMAILRLRLTPNRPRLIIWVQDIYSLGIAETGEGGVLAQEITRRIERWALHAADKVVVIHSRFAEFVTSELGVDSSRVVVARNWTHLPPSADVDRDDAKARLGWPSQLFLAVHTGNMGVKQGLENIVDAARLAEQEGAQVQFILVGSGGERQRLENYGRGIERLTFVDPLEDEDYRLALVAADVLLVNEKPGVSAMAMPSKLTAYFDAARPVVAATDLNGITASEITASDAGEVVPAGDPRALLESVLSIRDDPATAARYSTNGRRHRDLFLDEGVAMGFWSTLVRNLTGPAS